MPPFDQFPQFMNLTVIEDSAHTYKENAVASKVVQGIDTKGGAYVMNILKLFVDITDPDPVNVARCASQWHLSSHTKLSVRSLNEAGIVMRDEKVVEIFDTAATDATVVIKSDKNTQIYDLSDGKGNGFLYGRNQMFLGVEGSGDNTGIKRCNMKILYTMRKVSAAELLGMIAD